MNLRSPDPQPGALPTKLHPDTPVIILPYLCCSKAHKKPGANMTTWNKNPGGCSHMTATAFINLELPYDTHSDYHIVGNSQPASIIPQRVHRKRQCYAPYPGTPKRKNVIFSFRFSTIGPMNCQKMNMSKKIETRPNDSIILIKFWTGSGAKA